MGQVSGMLIIGSIIHMRLCDCARLDDEDWTRPVAVVERFLSRTHLDSACELPVVDAQNFNSHDFERHTKSGGASLLRGLGTRLANRSQWARDKFIARFSNYQVNVDRKRFDPPQWSTPTKTTVKEFIELVALSNISLVATGYKTRLEVDLISHIMKQLSPLLDDFDLKPTIQLAAALGSGTHFHSHEETWLLLLQGMKAWWVAPEKPSLTITHEAGEHSSHPCSWLGSRAPPGLSFCVQQAGDMIYLSDGQFHATCNLEDFVLGVGGQGHIPRDWSDLQRGVHRGHTSAVDEWKKSSSDQRILQAVVPDPSMPAGSALIHKTAQKDFSVVAVQLLEARAQVDQSHEPHHLQPLHHAASQGHLAVAEFLVRARANVNAVSAAHHLSDTCYACSPLHSAIQNGHDTLISFFLSKRANVDIPDGHGDLPLHLAAMSGRKAFAETLIQQGHNLEAVSPNGGNLCPLHLAAMTGHVDTALLLLHSRAKVASRSQDGRTPLHVAASSGHRTVVRLLLSWSAEAKAQDQHGRFPVHLAAYSGQAAIVDLLEARRGNDDRVETVDGSTPLHAAASGNRVEMVKLLLQRRISVGGATMHGMQAIHIAAELGHRAIVKSLLRSGGIVNVYTRDSEDPLQLAATNGYLQVVQLLVQQGAEVTSGHINFCERHCLSSIGKYLHRVFTKRTTRTPPQDSDHDEM